MRDELIRRLAERISPGDAASTVEILSRSPELAGDLSWLEDVFAAAAALPLPPVPPTLSATLHDLMPDNQIARWETATPIHDSRTAGELVGVRGQNASSGWTVMYTAASADVVLDGEPAVDGLTELTGQILVRVDSAGPFQVSVSGSSEAATRSDELGQFRIGSIAPGTYEFEARAEQFALRWNAVVGAT